jgi:hypothetical protein
VHVVSAFGPTALSAKERAMRKIEIGQYTLAVYGGELVVLKGRRLA